CYCRCCCCCCTCIKATPTTREEDKYAEPSNVQSNFIVTTNDYYKQLYGQQSSEAQQQNQQMLSCLSCLSIYQDFVGSVLLCLSRTSHSTKSNNNTQSNYTRDYLSKQSKKSRFIQ
uniref:Uncharacterized protein n=1 Tax=Glossina pallidipes TaxID=7398 RepID=A0A1B0A414_GLOPL